MDEDAEVGCFVSCSVAEDDFYHGDDAMKDLPWMQGFLRLLKCSDELQLLDERSDALYQASIKPRTLNHLHLYKHTPTH